MIVPILGQFQYVMIHVAVPILEVLQHTRSTLFLCDAAQLSLRCMVSVKCFAFLCKENQKISVKIKLFQIYREISKSL